MDYAFRKRLVAVLLAMLLYVTAQNVTNSNHLQDLENAAESGRINTIQVG